MARRRVEAPVCLLKVESQEGLKRRVYVQIDAGDVEAVESQEGLKLLSLLRGNV